MVSQIHAGALLLVLLWSWPCLAEEPGAALQIADCPREVEAELRRLLAVELGARSGPPGEPGAAPRLAIRCEP